MIAADTEAPVITLQLGEDLHKGTPKTVPGPDGEDIEVIVHVYTVTPGKNVFIDPWFTVTDNNDPSPKVKLLLLARMNSRSEKKWRIKGLTKKKSTPSRPIARSPEIALPRQSFMRR